jgi:hypothetical protein
LTSHQGVQQKCLRTQQASLMLLIIEDKEHSYWLQMLKDFYLRMQ